MDFNRISDGSAPAASEITYKAVSLRAAHWQPIKHRHTRTLAISPFNFTCAPATVTKTHCLFWCNELQRSCDVFIYLLIYLSTSPPVDPVAIPYGSGGRPKPVMVQTFLFIVAPVMLDEIRHMVIRLCCYLSNGCTFFRFYLFIYSFFWGGMTTETTQISH